MPRILPATIMQGSACLSPHAGSLLAWLSAGMALCWHGSLLAWPQACHNHARLCLPLPTSAEPLESIVKDGKDLLTCITCYPLHMLLKKHICLLAWPQATPPQSVCEALPASPPLQSPWRGEDLLVTNNICLLAWP